MILKRENIMKNTFIYILKLPSSVYDYVVISDSWFLILKMNGYLVACFYKFHMLEKQKLIKTKQPDRPSQAGL